MYDRLLEYVIRITTTFASLEGIFVALKNEFVVDIFKKIDVLSPEARNVINNLKKIQEKTRIHVFDFALINIAQSFIDSNILSSKAINTLRKLIRELNETELRALLIKKFPAFDKHMKEAMSNEPGSEYLLKQVEEILMKMRKQLSIFGD